jgi:hypothetical protein
MSNKTIFAVEINRVLICSQHIILTIEKWRRLEKARKFRFGFECWEAVEESNFLSHRHNYSKMFWKERWKMERGGMFWDDSERMGRGIIIEWEWMFLISFIRWFALIAENQEILRWSSSSFGSFPGHNLEMPEKSREEQERSREISSDLDDFRVHNCVKGL